MKTVTGGILRETIRCEEDKQKREPRLRFPYKKLAATYFSTNKCSIIGDVRLLPGSGTLLPTISSSTIHYSLAFNSNHSSCLCRHWNYSALNIYNSPIYTSSLLRFRFLVGLHSNNGSGFWALFTQKTNSPLLWLLKRRHGLRAPLKSN